LQKLDGETGGKPEVQAQDNPQQGESHMTMENVNLQELQRLNEAISVTFDAIRRVAPQLQAIQQMAQMQVPWQQQPYGVGMPPQHLVPLLQHLVQQFGQQQNPWTQYQQPFHFGQQPWGQPFGMGQPQYPQQYQPFGFGQTPFSFQQPFGIGQQYGQRIF
jgi:hypothetical protein